MTGGDATVDTARPPITLSNWLDPPYNRWGFQRVREIVPTAAIRNRTGQVRHLPRHERPLGTIMVDRLDGRRTTLDEQLAETCCDAICVVHDGAIVFERYLNGMREDTAHLLMSVSKSVCGAALGITAERGLLGVDDLVTDVAPELAGTSLDGATVQQVIDMATGTDFDEDYDLYLEPAGDAPLIEYERQAGYRPLAGHEPIGVLAHFRTYPTAFEHGTRFRYRSPLTNVAARLLEVATGMRFPDIVSRDLWGPLGQEHEADIMLDPLGQSVAEGGISCSVRDLARFGMAYLDDGTVMGTRILPEAWVADTVHGTDASVRNFAQGEFAESGWSHYRNAMWVFERDRVLSGLGIFGQYCYVHRPTRTVIARFSSYPEALPAEQSDETIATFATVCAELANERPQRVG
jgi:CubicO group peptidase (beta-lactamase class C family)